VEFEPGRALGFGLIRVEELSELLGGHRVDLVNPKYLNHRLRDRILADAELQYAEQSCRLRRAVPDATR